MEDIIKKKITTSWPFPLMKYKVDTKYIEVKKASGIAYIILELITRTENSSELLSIVLKQFGVPEDLHYIFADEIATLINLDIISMQNDLKFSSNYFDQYRILDFSITAKGDKIFAEGAIPTGNEGIKKPNIYYNPVSRKYDMRSQHSFFDLEKSFLDDQFVNNIRIDTSGLEEYISEVQTKIGLKKEERIINCEISEEQKLVYKVDNNMKINIDNDSIFFEFKNSDECAFFQKYFTANIVSKGLAAKKKFQFCQNKIEQVNIESIRRLSEMPNVTELYLPEELLKHALRPCKIMLNRGNYNISRKDNAIQIGADKSSNLLDMVDHRAEIALIDKEGAKLLIPAKVIFESSQLKGDCELYLLVERILLNGELSKMLNALYVDYLQDNYNGEAANIVPFIATVLKNDTYMTSYVDSQIKKKDRVDERISLYLDIHNAFIKNTNWEKYGTEYGRNMFELSCKEVNAENVIYKNTVLQPLKKILKMKNADYLKAFSASMKEKEKNSLVYQVLESIGYDTVEVLGVVNVVYDYVNNVLNAEPFEANNTIARKFNVLGNSLNIIKQLLGIESITEYAIKDDFDTEIFLNNYGTYTKTLKELLKYKLFAKSQFEDLEAYRTILEPIQEIVTIEKLALKNPEKINEKYIQERIVRGDWKNAICDLHVRLQFELENMLGIKNGNTFEMIDIAERKNLISYEEADICHKLRLCRNGFQHPRKKNIEYNRDIVNEWCKVVFELGGEHESSGKD